MALNPRCIARAASCASVTLRKTSMFKLMLIQVQALRNPPFAICYKRCYSTTKELDLKSTLRTIIPEKRELVKKVRSHANKKIGDLKIENTLGGMRYRGQPPFSLHSIDVGDTEV